MLQSEAMPTVSNAYCEVMPKAEDWKSVGDREPLGESGACSNSVRAHLESQFTSGGEGVRERGKSQQSLSG